MKTLHLYRFKSSDQGTFGILAVDGHWWHSLELPDRHNKPNISCIPKGEYQVSERYSPHFRRKLYHVENVPNRSYILIHPANFAGDTEKGWQTHLQGCITLGKRVGRAINKFGKRQKCVFLSRQAITEMMDYLNDRPFILKIEDA